MQTISKMHEKNVQNDVHVEKVDTILSDVENVPFALRGATVKTILYWLFSVIAAAELSTALFFYVSSMGAPQAVAAVIAAVIGFFFHGLIHAQLTDTAKGMVFSKHRESKAMSSEVKMNIVLSIILLAVAANAVFFLGKKGFSAYRVTKYETAQNESKPKDGIKSIAITADMLTNKKGKISSDKLEQLAAVTNATTKATETTVQAASADREKYDASTANITDVVGSSAFILELILGLLAYAIATAKFAATFDEIAKRNTNNTPSVVTNEQRAPDNVPKDTPSVVSDNKTDVKQMPYTELIDGLKESLCQNLASSYNLLHGGEDVTGVIIHETLTTIGANVLTDNKKYVAIATDCRTDFNHELCKRLGITQNVTQNVTQQKPIGFNRKVTNTGNDGRTIVKGFQRQETKKNEVITQNVTQTVSDEKLRICEFCDEPYVYGHARQKYCCDECRISAWQEKSGVALRKKVKI